MGGNFHILGVGGIKFQQSLGGAGEIDFNIQGGDEDKIVLILLNSLVHQNSPRPLLLSDFLREPPDLPDPVRVRELRSKITRIIFHANFLTDANLGPPLCDKMISFDYSEIYCST